MKKLLIIAGILFSFSLSLLSQNPESETIRGDLHIRGDLTLDGNFWEGMADSVIYETLPYNDSIDVFVGDTSNVFINVVYYGDRTVGTRKSQAGEVKIHYDGFQDILNYPSYFVGDTIGLAFKAVRSNDSIFLRAIADNSYSSNIIFGHGVLKRTGLVFYGDATSDVIAVSDTVLMLQYYALLSEVRQEISDSLTVLLAAGEVAVMALDSSGTGPGSYITGLDFWTDVPDMISDSLALLMALGEVGVAMKDSIGGAEGTYVTGNHGLQLDNMLQDSLGIVLVESYGAVGDDATDCTQAFEDALDAAGDFGTVELGYGIYRVDSILIDKSQSLIGQSSGLSGTSISAVRGMKNNPVIYKWPDGAGYTGAYGGSIEKLTVLGSASADSSEQHGIQYYGANHAPTNDVYIYGVGGYGIRLAGEQNCDSYTFTNVRTQHCHLGGVRGSGTYTNGSQLNAITFDRCSFSQNYGYGMWITGTSIGIHNSTLQNNDSCAIFISYRGLNESGEADVTVTDCYFEVNGGSSVVVETGYMSGSYTHALNRFVFKDNYSYENSADVDSPLATANVSFVLEDGSAAIQYNRGTEIGNNTFAGTGLPYVDGNGLLDLNAEIYINPRYTNPADLYVNIPEAQIKLASGRKIITPTVAGITDAMFGETLYVYGMSGNIDITADPQIEDGIAYFQTMTISVFDGGNTLTLDDGAGLNLSAQWVGDTGDFITLTFIAGDWYEVSRSDN